MTSFEVFDLDYGDVLADFSREEDAVAAFELACQADEDWLRRLVVSEIDGTGHSVRVVRGPYA